LALAVALIVGVIFGAWTGVSLAPGKFFNTRDFSVTDRRKEPIGYWFCVAVTGVASAACFFTAATNSISN
jgi:hypothetical protein